MRILEILLFIQFCLFVSADIKINSLKIPDGIENNKTDEVILDCDYSFGDTDRNSLVIKWYFPYGERVIYQWIPRDGSGKPRIIAEPFKSIVDLNYMASDNPLTMHRALKINKISPEITGNYSCSVSSDYSEARKTKRLVVYRKADKVEFFHLEDSDMYICAAYGVYPQPIMNIYVFERNLTRIEDGDDNYDNRYAKSNEDGIITYNVTSSYKYLKSEITEQTQFICKLSIPDTDYHEIYYSHLLPENSGVIHRLSGMILMGLIFVIFN